VRGRPFGSSWSGGIGVTRLIPTLRTTIILKSESRSTVLDVEQQVVVGPKAIFPSFDDNKTYVVMFLTILFN